jgi:hypothetical protein
MRMRAGAYRWASLDAFVLTLVLACDQTTTIDQAPECASIDPTGLVSESAATGSACPAPEVLKGTVPESGACTQSSDCQAACCACVGGGKSALAALCDNGTCASPGDTCCVFRGIGTTQCGS